MNYEIVYPEHNHPHGIENTNPNEYLLWICSECKHIFTDTEIRNDELGNSKQGGWGHLCKHHPVRKNQRCESHLEPYKPVLGVTE